jgi:hypothetical protein
MKKYRYIVNIIILVTIILTACYSVYSSLTSPFVLSLRFYIGVLFIIATVVTFAKNKNVFTLFLFLHLLIGNFCGLTCLLYVFTGSSFLNLGSLSLPLYWGQPFYSILLVIYIVFNSGIFIGIASKKYWDDFLTRNDDLELVLRTVDPSDDSEKSLRSNSREE